MASEIRVNSITNRSGLSTVTWNNHGLNVVGIVTATKLSGPFDALTAGSINVSGDAIISGNLGVAGTITSEDKTNIDSVGLITARTGIKIGPIAGVAGTFYADGSYRTTGIITATTYYGSGANLTGLSGVSVANQADNRLVTATGTADALNAESRLTWDGSHLQVSSGEGQSCKLSLYSDEGDDNNDKWHMLNDGGGNLWVENFAAGSWHSNAKFVGNGGQEFYHQNVKRLETTTTGVTVTGNLSVTGTVPGGITHINQWEHGGFNANNTNGDLTASWSECNQANYGNTLYSLLGSSLTQSSGIFSFPSGSEGHWLISHALAGYCQNTNNRNIGNRIYISTNGGSSWSQKAHSQWNNWDGSGVDNGVVYGSCYCQVALDITSVTNFRIKFWYQTENNAQISGGTGNHATFIRLADT